MNSWSWKKKLILAITIGIVVGAVTGAIAGLLRTEGFQFSATVLNVLSGGLTAVIVVALLRSKNKTADS